MIVFLIFSLVLVSIAKVYQTLKTLFDHIANYLLLFQKYSAGHHILDSHICTWKCG